MAHKIFVCNNKGGAGKTTIAVNLADALAQMDFKILLLDFDSQSHVAEHLGLNGDKGLYNLIASDIQIRDIVTPIYERNFDVIMNYNDFWYDYEILVAEGLLKKENVIKTRLAAIENDYDYIIIDSPPMMLTLIGWGMEYADWVLVPMDMRYLNIAGFAYIRKMVQRYGHGDREILGIIPTMYRSRIKEIEDGIQYFREDMPNIRMGPIIRQCQEFSNAQSNGKTILKHKPSSNAGKDIKQLAHWVVETIRKETAPDVGKRKPVKKVKQ